MVNDKWWIEQMGKTPEEALEEAEMVIIFVDRNDNTYGPIMAYNRKLDRVEIEELARKRVG